MTREALFARAKFINASVAPIKAGVVEMGGLTEDALRGIAERLPDLTAYHDGTLYYLVIERETHGG